MRWLRTRWQKFTGASGEIKIFIIAVIVMFVILIILSFHPFTRLAPQRTPTEDVTVGK